jgi:cobalamin biosynthesis protein CbiD
LKSIETLLTHQLLYDNAQQLQKRINQENGVENAIAVIEKV